MLLNAFLSHDLTGNSSGCVDVSNPQNMPTMPDGFSIWHHLDAHGIPFKSITPKNDTLLITFDSSDQSAAAKAVLDRTLPHGYIIAQQDNNSQAMQWLTRLRDNSHRFG
ncbi:EnvZ/OmpR regulon moderator MzrA [Escherichia coli]|nr:EnvZ/OmpR regulon moderator MzrA [Escherichia coli]